MDDPDKDDERHYRAYTINNYGRIESAYPLEADTDVTAINQAKRLVADCAVEVWERGRLVKVLNPIQPRPFLALQ